MPLELNHSINTSTMKSERIIYEHARRMFRRIISCGYLVRTVCDAARQVTLHSALDEPPDRVSRTQDQSLISSYTNTLSASSSRESRNRL
jgi:hypothetical protein